MKIFYAFNYINITPVWTVPFQSTNFVLKALDSTLKFLFVYFITRLSKSSFSGLEDAGQLVDHLYIQFYNNYCHTGAGKWFINTLNQWLAFSKRTKPKGPLIFIALPPATRASSGAQYYRPPDELTAMYQVGQYRTSKTKGKLSTCLSQCVNTLPKVFKWCRTPNS